MKIDRSSQAIDLYGIKLKKYLATVDFLHFEFYCNVSREAAA